ncbi:hypothetical protein L1049_010435 [Liquidambar formosana]|uniref:non-specific serine/threonine protein kinase n=1 Tax=Liquidambar formosana TaxID=63359 RepID=A0AAP0N9C4_LIQFO
MGTVYWKFNADSCQVEMVGLTLNPPDNSKANITCDCSIDNNTCHIVALDLEANQFFGAVPSELGKLVNIKTLFLSSNRLSGNLPKELAELRSLRDLVLRSCNISGQIPEYILQMNYLELLDLSFNNDLSYNNLMRQNPEQPACQENRALNLNLFRSSSMENNLCYKSTLLQDKLVQKDFNIADEAPGFVRPLTKQFNATVTNNKLEIQFFWAGKGTTRIPVRGVYGPLISAISVDPNFKPHSQDERKRIEPIVAGVVGLLLIFLAFGFLWWRSYLGAKSRREKDLRGLDLQTSSFTLKQIRAATDNFDSVNKIGEGGFGPVYKGQLSDGTVIAVKQLSSKSSQGNCEFLNEIGMISCLQHPNLVKLYGCCIEGDQLLLIYEYLENNSLAHSLFGLENCQVKLDWPTRHKICVGIAKGLAFLHEESRLKIVHRDIKATNVLLDRDLNPKISNFGLAKLYEDQKTHISTRIAGTIGYMAPEYALWGYLTCKADVYSFGIVALEIVSGKHKMTYGPGNNCACLLDWINMPAFDDTLQTAHTHSSSQLDADPHGWLGFLKRKVAVFQSIERKLPLELSGLRNLMDFRINDNNFDGTIPDFIQNWTQLDRLEMHASGLKGPIPSSISVLEKLTQLRISDINGSSQDFPVLGNMTGLRWLVLRSCNISGEIPEYILQMNYLELLDLSLNKLVGEIPSVIPSYSLIMIFLSGNFLSGNIPNSILKKGATVDLSYNNLMRQNPEQPACQENKLEYIFCLFISLFEYQHLITFLFNTSIDFGIDIYLIFSLEL